MLADLIPSASEIQPLAQLNLQIVPGVSLEFMAAGSVVREAGASECIVW
jgi:hypothetical protein